MKNSTLNQALQPKIVKYVENSHSGIGSVNLSRYALGYLLQGTKYIHCGDRRFRISRGEVFYMGVGHHYVENVADDDNQFEQITIYYTPAQLQRILSHLNLSYDVQITNGHTCDRCGSQSYVSMPATNTLRSFFQSCNNYLRYDYFCDDSIAEDIKMTELIYMIVSGEDCCIKNKILNNIDFDRENFDQIIYEHIFKDISIEQLASASHRSLTSFKKEFKRRFSIPPHRWYIRQRLTHSRMLLLSTSKSISEIGNECAFPNTSHFIKLFKKEFKMTPATYRSTYMPSRAPQGRESENRPFGNEEDMRGMMEMGTAVGQK